MAMPLCDVLYARDDACVQVEVCVCIRGRSYMMYCGANEVVNLTTEFFFSKNKNKTPFMTKSRTQSADNLFLRKKSEASF